PLVTATAGLQLFGGFTATTGVDETRGSSLTVLHGASSDGVTAHSVHTLVAADDLVLDQLEIRDGLLSGTGAGARGAGVYSVGANNVLLHNVTVDYNEIDAASSSGNDSWGAGIYV